MDHQNNIWDKDNMKVHMVGIGALSMSGLAEILMHKGVKISGSDLVETEITERLKSMGATIYYSHSANNIDNQNLIVYTAAVSKDSTEIIETKIFEKIIHELKIKVSKSQGVFFESRCLFGSIKKHL